MNSTIFKTVLSVTIVCCLPLFFSCKKTKGCTDPNALNHNLEADKNDGSCSYSTAVFYMTVINPSRPVTVSVNGISIGTMTAQYPGGPGNCIAPGCVSYKFKSGQKVDWVATEPGGLIWTGTAEPSKYADCMKIRVY